jgi:predicted phage terminase large subunit-like protein
MDRATLTAAARHAPSLEDSWLAVDRRRCEESLYRFMQGAWKYIDTKPFVPGWHLEAIAEHLEAVCDGEISRLIINQPPRTSKSSMLVAFDAWVWAQRHVSTTSGPQVQFLHSSYAGNLSIRDSVKTRRLMSSVWYQQRWGNRFMLTGDQNTKIKFENDKGGYRLSTSVGGQLTGDGGDVLVIDDPHNTGEAESEAVRQGVLDWYDQSMSTRFNDPRTGALILVMQRLHEDDLCGHILGSDLGGEFVHLMLPMEYERDRAVMLYPNAIGWSDPRTEEGELLTPERFGPKEVARLKSGLGPYGSAGQLQQRPEPKGGGILKRDWWMLWNEAKFPNLTYIIASLDTAYTEKQENDPSAMTVWGVFEDVRSGSGANAFMSKPGKRVHGEGTGMSSVVGRPHTKVILMAAWQERLELHDLVEKVIATTKRFNIDKLLIESKASGQSVAQEIRRLYQSSNFAVQLVDPGAQDKRARAYSVQHLFSEGMVYAPDRAWADMVITQCAAFPKAKHDDLVDTVTQAVRHLRDIGLLVRSEERDAEEQEAMQFRGNNVQPLYPV